MITKYFQFFELIKEALSAEQSKQKSEEFIFSIYKNDEIAKKKVSIKNRELKDKEISNEDWKRITKEISDIKSKYDVAISKSEKAKRDYLKSKKEDKNPDFSDETTKKYDEEIAKNLREKQEELNKLTEDKYSKVIQINDLVNTEGKLSETELEEVKKKSLEDPFYKRLLELLEKNDRLDLIDYFIRLFYRDYSGFKIDLDVAKPNNNFDEVRNVLGNLTYLPETNEILWNTNDNYGLFGSVLNRFKLLEPKLQTKILDNFEKYKKMQEEELKKPTDVQRIPGIDMLSNDVRDMQIDFYVDSLLKRLPTGSKDKKTGKQILPDLNTEYENLKDTDPLKIKIKEELGKLVQILIDLGVNFESKIEPLKDDRGKDVLGKNGKPVMVKVFTDVEKQFKMRKGTRSDPQEDKSLEDFLTRVQSKIQSLSNFGIERLYKMIDDVNDEFGAKNGAKVVYVSDKSSDKPIIIFQVKSAKANWYLHNNKERRKTNDIDEKTGEFLYDSGRLTPTRHCIAYPTGSNMWKTYIKEGYKLFYIYNFGLEVSDVLFPIGLIIDEDGNIKSSHRKDDTDVKGNVKELLQSWGVDFELVFEGLTPEEKERKRKKKEAEDKLLNSQKLSIAEFKEYLEYADPNLGGGRILLNCVNEGNLEKLELLSEKDTDFNEPPNILDTAVNLYINSNQPIRDLIVNKLLEIRNRNIEGVVKNLGNNPVVQLKSYLKNEEFQKLEYVLNKIKRDYDFYDPDGKLMGLVSNLEEILYLNKYGCKINNLYFDTIKKILFPNKQVDNDFILKSKQILEDIPSKSNHSEYNVTVNEIFLEALRWSYKTNNLNYFKMILDISKRRLDEGEDDFIDTFLDETTDQNDKSILPQDFKSYLKTKLNEWNYFE